MEDERDGSRIPIAQLRARDFIALVRTCSRLEREREIEKIGQEPALTLLVAEIVLGWPAPRYHPSTLLGSAPVFTSLGGVLEPEADRHQRRTIPDFGSSLEATFRHVVDVMTSVRGLSFTMGRPPSDVGQKAFPWLAAFTLQGRYHALDGTGDYCSNIGFSSSHARTEVAICRAALKACLYLDKWAALAPVRAKPTVAAER